MKPVMFAALAFVLGGQGMSVLSAIQQPGVNVGAIMQDNLLTPALLIFVLTAEKYLTAQANPPITTTANFTPEGMEAVLASRRQWLRSIRWPYPCNLPNPRRQARSRPLRKAL